MNQFLVPLVGGGFALLVCLIGLANAMVMKRFDSLEADINQEQKRRHDQFDALNPILGEIQIGHVRLVGRVDDCERRLGNLEK